MTGVLLLQIRRVASADLKHRKTGIAAMLTVGKGRVVDTSKAGHRRLKRLGQTNTGGKGEGDSTCMARSLLSKQH